MNREEIHNQLKELANKIAALSNEVMMLEGCVGVKVEINIVNMAGIAQVMMDIKTTGDKKLEEILQHSDGVEIVIEGQEKEEPLPPVDVEEELKNILGNRPGNDKK